VSWTYGDPEGDPQRKYQVQIDDDINFTSIIVDSGIVISESEEYFAADVAFQYNNTTYYTRVRVWDDQGFVSDWSDPAGTFTTPQQAAPTVNFSWTPFVPALNEQVYFNNLSTPGTSWAWDFDCDDPNINPSNPECQYSTSALQSPLPNRYLVGTSTMPYNVELQVSNGTDTCSKTLPLYVGSVRVPTWREVSID